MRRITTAAALFLAASLYPDIESNSQIAAGEADVDSIRVERDRQEFVSRVTLTAHNGRITWADLLRGVARVQGYDDRALQGTLPYGTLKLEGYTARLLMASADRLFGAGVNLSVERPTTSTTGPGVIARTASTP